MSSFETGEMIVSANINVLMLGCDESVLKLNPINGYIFKKVSINNFEHKDEIVNSRGIVRSDYYTSKIVERIDNSTHTSLIILEKNNDFIIPSVEIKTGYTIDNTSINNEFVDKYNNDENEIIKKNHI